MDWPGCLSVMVIEVYSGQNNCALRISDIEIGAHHGLQ